MYSSEGYGALRTASAIVSRGDRGILVVTGQDRLEWLQGLVTNDVAALAPGESCYAAYLTPQGRMISDMRVAQLEDRTMLEVPAALAESLHAKLDALLFTEEARVVDATAALLVIDLIGPEAPGVYQAALASGLQPVAVLRDDVYGVPGITVIVDRAVGAEAVRSLSLAGAVETTLETLDVVRIEAGAPLFLVDMDEHTIPLEAGVERRGISFSKGCYVGQEVIVRVMHRGQGRVAKRLVGILLPKDSPARPLDLIKSGDREVGRVTSATWSPALERHIALGYLHRDFSDAGTAVEVQTQKANVPATIAPLPFVVPVASRV